ncbi:MAG: hypothetical protein J6U35_04070 [Clostridia bacterium]|nr:hypothetical protein [Clostridia bacterium]
MKLSKMIALSAIATAFAVILLTLGSYVELIDIVCVMYAGVAIMLPLAKQSYPGAALTFIASAALGLLLGGMRFTVIVPFAVFFGLYPIANALQIRFRINKYLALAIKDVWFLGTMVLYYKLMAWLYGYDLFEDFPFMTEALKRYVIPAMFVVGALFFILYDFIMMKMQLVVNKLVEKLKF